MITYDSLGDMVTVYCKRQESETPDIVSVVQARKNPDSVLFGNSRPGSRGFFGNKSDAYLFGIVNSIYEKLQQARNRK